MPAPSPFTAAPNGWRLAFGDRKDRDIVVVPIVGWMTVPPGAPKCLMSSPLEPVVLWDNVEEPIIGTGYEYVRDNPTSYVHQVLAPGFDVREAPDGWKIMEYGD